MNLKSNSDFLVLAQRGGLYLNEPFTICDLFWRALWGTVMTIFLVGFFAVFGALIFGPWIASIIFWITDGWFYLGYVHMVLPILFGGFLTVFGGFALIEKTSSMDPLRPLYEFYKARNEKYCSYVKVVDNETL